MRRARPVLERRIFEARRLADDPIPLAMRERRRARGLREVRLVVPDARSRAVRRRVAKQVARLDPERERDALKWIESVSEFDADATR